MTARDLPRPLGLLLLILAGALPLAASATGGCDGYGELPVPHREDAPLTVEATALRAGTTGLVQLSVQLPEDASGPLVVVGSPVVEPGDGATGSTDAAPQASGSAPGAVQGWAWGPCDGLGGPEGPPGPGQVRLCVAVWTPGPGPLALALVLEARGAGRRFTARGEIPEVAW